MTNVDSTTTSTILDACDLLARTELELSFIQSFTYIPKRGEDLTLDASQLSGLCYVLDNIRDNITKAIEQLSNHSTITAQEV